MKILFVSSSDLGSRAYLDHSSRYRCFHLAEELAELGHRAEVTTFQLLDIKSLGRYDVVVFQKRLHSRRLERQVESRRAQGPLLIADYDDLIFGEDNYSIAPSYLLGRTAKRYIRTLYRNNTRALECFNHFTVSTTSLAHELTRKKPSALVAVIHNRLSRYWLERNNGYKNTGTNRRIITYLPGTTSHDADFAEVEAVLAAYIRSDKEVQLRVVGHLRFHPEKFDPDRIEHLPYQPYVKIPQLIASSWLTVAPLRDNCFNRCKSAVKFYESAAFGTPVIATPIPDLIPHRQPGLFLAATTEEWTASLENLANTHDYSQYSTALYDYARRKLMVREQASIWLDRVHEWLG